MKNGINQKIDDEKYKDHKREYLSEKVSLKDKYRVPPKLIKELIKLI